MYNYLPHPSNMRTNDHVLAMRIQEGAAGYGIYMMLLELLRDAEGRALVFNPKHLAFAMNESDVELVQRVVKDYGLFTLSDDGKFTSPWLEAAMDEYDAKKRAASEAGRRGAAARYSKQAEPKPYPESDVATPKGSHGDPIAPPMGSLKGTHGNITKPNIIEENRPNEPTTKSKLLALSWGSMDGQSLFDLARKDGPILGQLDQDEAKRIDQRLEGGYNKTYYAMGVYNIAAFFNLTSPMFFFLLELTHNGHRGTEAYVRLREILEHCKKTKFMPKYPAEYILVKMLSHEK